MHPGSHDEAVGETRVGGLDRAIDAQRSHQVLGVEPAAHGEDRAANVVQMPPDRTRLPERIVGWMREEFVPGGICRSEQPRQVGQWTGAQEELVAVLRAVVERHRHLRWRRRLRLRLVHPGCVEGVREHERAAVIPVVIEEEVGDRRLWRRCLDGRVRVDDPGHGEEPRIRDSPEADAAIVIGHMPQEPLDGVPSVGILVDIRRSRLLGPMRGHVREGAL